MGTFILILATSVLGTAFFAALVGILKEMDKNHKFPTN